MQSFDGKLYAIGYEIVGENTTVHLFEDPGTGTWSEVTSFVIQENKNPNYNPLLPQQVTGEDWRNNEPVGRMSVHVLSGKLVVLFQSMLDMQNGSVDSRWKLHLATFDHTNWAAAPVIRCLVTGSTAYTLLKSSGPIIFDSIVKSDMIYCCFNYGADESLDINQESVGLVKITEAGQTFFTVTEKRPDTVKHIFLDNDSLLDKIYMSVLFDQKLVYLVHPYIDLINYLIDMDEVRTCARLSAHLGFIGHIGLTNTYPRRISIHNTYFIPVEDDARSLSWHFYDNFIVFFYITNDNLRCVQFNFGTYNYKKGDALANIDPRQYNIATDDGVDTNYMYSHVLYSSVAYLNLRFDAVIDAPVPELPVMNTIINTSVVDYVFFSPTESQNNPLHFKVTVNRDGKVTTFDSEVSNTNWFYNPTGDHREWIHLPSSGLAHDFFGKPVKVVARRTDLL